MKPWILISALGVSAAVTALYLHQTPQAKKSTQTTPSMATQQEPLPKHLQGVKLSRVNWKKKPETYWKKVLTPLQFRVCRKAGTEYPFTGKHLRNNKKGYFVCSSCGQVLFSSDTKFKSGTGWPSFTRPYNKKVITENVDRSHGMVRTEVVCSRCNAHLGHVFDDGPAPTGLRYCINSVCLHHQTNLPEGTPQKPAQRK